MCGGLKTVETPWIRTDHTGRSAPTCLSESQEKVAISCADSAGTCGSAWASLSTVGTALAANAALVAFLNGYFWKPLPMARAADHVEIAGRDAAGRINSAWASSHALRLKEGAAPVLEQAYAVAERRAAVVPSGGTEPQPAVGAVATREYFALVEPRLAIGRLPFASASGGEDAAGIVLSDAGWRRLAANRPDVVGQAIRIDDAFFTVTGVMMPSVTGLEPITPDFWVLADTYESMVGPLDHGYVVGGLLRRGVTASAASEAMTGVVRSLPSLDRAAPPRTAALVLPRTTLDQGAGRAGPAHPHPARGLCPDDARGLREPVRHLPRPRRRPRRATSPSASPLARRAARVVRQVLLESVTLAVHRRRARLRGRVADGRSPAGPRVLGGPPGRPDDGAGERRLECRACTPWSSRWPSAASARSRRHWRHSRRIPAHRADGRPGARRRAARIGRSSASSLPRQAISLTLLLAAGIVVKNATRAREVETGYDLAPLVDLGFERLTPATRGAVPARSPRRGGHDRVRHAVGGTVAPGGREGGRHTQRLAHNVVDHRFFETLRIPILRGRAFDPSDGADGVRHVVVSASAARLLWSDQNPVGQHVDLDLSETEVPRWERHEVVGVAADALAGFFFEGRETPDALPARARSPRRAPSNSSPACRAAARPAPTSARSAGRTTRTPLCRPMTLRALLDRQQVPFTVAAEIASGLGGVTLVLACIGLYGLVSFSVVRQTRDIGIRMALGATQRSVLVDVLRGAGRRMLQGAAFGLPAAAALLALLEWQVPMIETFDPAVFLLVPTLLLAAGVITALVPARRASRVDPIVALRRD